MGKLVPGFALAIVDGPSTRLCTEHTPRNSFVVLVRSHGTEHAKRGIVVVAITDPLFLDVVLMHEHHEESARILSGMPC